ncbi:MAG: YlxR family protein [Gaiellaceae bacterium]
MPRQEPAVRTCVGCGRKAPKDELCRFVAPDGELALGPDDEGRGAYTCRRLSCFERALSRNAFNRTLRRRVVVPPNLSRAFEGLYTGGR